MASRRKSPKHKITADLLTSNNLEWHAARVLEEEEALELLRQAVEQEGSQYAFARRHAVDRTHLNFVLQGKRSLSEKFLTLLRLRKVYTADQ